MRRKNRLRVGDVVVEAFGCDPPAPFVQRMVGCTHAPVWINLEYLSAEAVVARNHGLPSPQMNGPGKGLTKWFFYPGFSGGTGGLIREPWLAEAQRVFDAQAWFRARGLGGREGEQFVSLFCYANPAVPALLDALSRVPTLLLTTPGPAAQQVLQELGPTLARGGLRAVMLPLLSQRDFDALLWACDLNFVRGEDSFVRAQWAGRPFVWQIYPQADNAHREKLEAFLALFVQGVDTEQSRSMKALWSVWNDMAHGSLELAPLEPWREHCKRWRGRLWEQADLAGQLIRFATERR